MQADMVRCINLFPDFFERSPSAYTLFLKNDVHWTPAGHKVVANRILTHMMNDYKQIKASNQDK